MRKTLGTFIAALLLGSVLVMQPAAASTTAPAAPAAPTGGPTPYETKLVWSSGTIIAEAYGTRTYSFDSQWVRKNADGSIQVVPGFALQWSGSLVDRRLTGQLFAGCLDAPVYGPQGWHKWGNWCDISDFLNFWTHKVWEVDMDYVTNNTGSFRDIDIDGAKFDYLGNVAWVWEYNPGA